MSITKTQRVRKRQLGQFITPPLIAEELLSDLPFTREDRVLEPSMGDGSFIIPIIEKFMTLYDGDIQSRLSRILSSNVYGVEIDADLFARSLQRIEKRWGPLPLRHNLIQGDFFRFPPRIVEIRRGVMSALSGFLISSGTHPLAARLILPFRTFWIASLAFAMEGK